MPAIYPKVTGAKLKKSARKTSEGKGRAALPGVKTDAKHVNATDKCGYHANRELAEMIRQAVRAKKTADKSGAHFVLGYLLRYAGLLDEAERECDTALLVDAQDAGVRSCAVAFMLHGDYAHAEDYLRLDLGSEWEKALSVDLLLRESPALDRKHQTRMLMEVTKLIWGPPTRATPLGKMDPEAFKRTADIAAK